MFKKLNIKTLSILFVVFATVLLITLFKDSSDNDKTFRDEFYTVDSSQVKTILLYPQSENHTEIKLVNTSGKEWEVQNKTIKAESDTAGVQSLLKTIVHLKPIRLAAGEKERWKEFNVNDSLGTRIKALDADQKILIDIVVGKFSYNQQSRSGITYVRMYDDEKVYAAEGFLPMMCNRNFDSWRNKNIINGSKDNWTTLTFSYPADSGFTLRKNENTWLLNNEKCDSAKAEQYLNGITRVMGSKFVENFNGGGKELFSLKVEGNNQSAPVVVKAYLSPDITEKYIINSSINPKSYFSSASGNLFQTIFPVKTALLPADSSKTEKNLYK